MSKYSLTLGLEGNSISVTLLSMVILFLTLFNKPLLNSLILFLSKTNSSIFLCLNWVSKSLSFLSNIYRLWL